MNYKDLADRCASVELRANHLFQLNEDIYEAVSVKLDADYCDYVTNLKCMEELEEYLPRHSMVLLRTTDRSRYDVKISLWRDGSNVPHHEIETSAKTEPLARMRAFLLIQDWLEVNS